VVASVVILAAAFWLARQWWLLGDRVWGVGLVGLAIACATPIAWQHHWFWAVPTAVAIARVAQRPRLAMVVWALPFLVGVPLTSFLRRDLGWPDAVWQVTGSSEVVWTIGVLVYSDWALRRARADARITAAA
jgi:alpha-1,2-mannosyltransferase